MSSASSSSVSVPAATSFQGPFPTDFTRPKVGCNGLTSTKIVGLDFATSCLPEDFNVYRHVYYSPGTGCPSGYTAPPQCTRSTDSITTTLTCCPQRGDVIALSCVQDPETLRAVWTNYMCTWTAGSLSTVLLVTSAGEGGKKITSAVTMQGPDGVNAYGLEMVYEQSDLTPTTSSHKTSSPSQSKGSDNGDGQPESHDALSTGAKAAIGVVVPLVAIALLIGAFFLFRRRKRRRDEAASGVPADRNELSPEDARWKGTYSLAPQELQGSTGVPERHEMDGRSKPVELRGSS